MAGRSGSVLAQKETLSTICIVKTLTPDDCLRCSHRPIRHIVDCKPSNSSTQFFVNGLEQFVQESALDFANLVAREFLDDKQLIDVATKFIIGLKLRLKCRNIDQRIKDHSDPSLIKSKNALDAARSGILHAPAGSQIFLNPLA